MTPPRDDRWRKRTATLMADAGLTQWNVANHVAQALKRPSFTQATVQSALSGRTRPPLDVLELWAEAMGLRGSERDDWYELALADQLPPFLVSSVARWRRKAR